MIARPFRKASGADIGSHSLEPVRLPTGRRKIIARDRCHDGCGVAPAVERNLAQDRVDLFGGEILCPLQHDGRFDERSRDPVRLGNQRGLPGTCRQSCHRQ